MVCRCVESRLAEGFDGHIQFEKERAVCGVTAFPGSYFPGPWRVPSSTDNYLYFICPATIRRAPTWGNSNLGLWKILHRDREELASVSLSSVSSINLLSGLRQVTYVLFGPPPLFLSVKWKHTHQLRGPLPRWRGAAGKVLAILPSEQDTVTQVHIRSRAEPGGASQPEALLC